METMSNAETEKLLRTFLVKNNFNLTPKRGMGELGVDIIATKGEKSYYIECIGYNKSNPIRSKEFFEVFFRAISRLNQNADSIVIALPNLFRKGISQRIKQYYVGWVRIGEAFPELEIWFVDEKDVEMLKWNEVFNQYKPNKN